MILMGGDGILPDLPAAALALTWWRATKGYRDLRDTDNQVGDGEWLWAELIQPGRRRPIPALLPSEAPVQDLVRHLTQRFCATYASCTPALVATAAVWERIASRFS